MEARRRHAAQLPGHLKEAARDRRVELVLGTLAAGTLALIAAMLVTVMVNGWPSFEANGLGWFGTGGDIVRSSARCRRAPRCPATRCCTSAPGR